MTLLTLARFNSLSVNQRLPIVIRELIDLAAKTAQLRYRKSHYCHYTPVHESRLTRSEKEAVLMSTMGWTLSTIDNMGRVTRIETFSGSALRSPWGSNPNSTGFTHYEYSGSSSGYDTTATDQAGVTRVMSYDGLGRLVPVTEREIVATSIKSIDLRAATYLNPAKLEGTLSGYVDKLASFNGATLKGVTVSAGEIPGRVLEVAVPKGTATVAQQAALARVVRSAAQVGVKVVFVPVK